MVTNLLETQKVGRLSGVSGHHGGLSNFVGKSNTLAKGTMLHSGGEERAGINLLPQVKAVKHLRSGESLREKCQNIR
jgi:hypothetical protein